MMESVQGDHYCLCRLRLAAFATVAAIIKDGILEVTIIVIIKDSILELTFVQIKCQNR
jgi:hypothetical protein